MAGTLNIVQLLKTVNSNIFFALSQFNLNKKIDLDLILEVIGKEDAAFVYALKANVRNIEQQNIYSSVMVHFAVLKNLLPSKLKRSEDDAVIDADYPHSTFRVNGGMAIVPITDLLENLEYILSVIDHDGSRDPFDSENYDDGKS